MNKKSNSTNSTKAKFNTKTIVVCALLIALAFVTSFIKLFPMPMGGSVTLLSMFFITYIGYIYGLKIGLVCGLVYGFLQYIIEPYFVSVIQVIFDYGLSFMALGLSGLFKNSNINLNISLPNSKNSSSRVSVLQISNLHIGYLVGIIGRLVFSVLSGILFFSIYAKEAHMNAFMYSFAYNGSYIGIEGLITLILISIPVLNKQLVKFKSLLS